MQFDVMRFPSYAFDPATGVATFDYLLDGAGAAEPSPRRSRSRCRPTAATRRTPSAGCSSCCTWSPG